MGTRRISKMATSEQKNMELMQTLDDAWNAQDWALADRSGRLADAHRCAQHRRHVLHAAYDHGLNLEE